MGNIVGMIVAGVVGGAVSVLVVIWLRSRLGNGPEMGSAGKVPPSMEEVHRLKRAGRKIAAIKVYRDLHDVGLKEAKQAVEKL